MSHETLTAPILSTKHLQKDELDRLHSYPGGSFVGKRGILVYVGGSTALELTSGMWPTLCDCARWTRSKGWEWIMFDDDGDVTKEISTY